MSFSNQPFAENASDCFIPSNTAVSRKGGQGVFDLLRELHVTPPFQIKVGQEGVAFLPLN